MDNPSETTSRFGGPLGAALLMAVLFALVLGIYGAVYIDAFKPARLQPASTTAPVPTPPPPAIAMAPQSPSAPSPQIPPNSAANLPPRVLAQINPMAGRSTPAPVEAAKPPYWVEYGAYRGTFYAEKLVERLGASGIQTEINRVRGPGGRWYFSVRSFATTDRTNAQISAHQAARLGIAPLIHRGEARADVQPIVAKAVSPAPRQVAGQYWVQFGAYNVHAYAVALRDRLRRGGLEVTILKRDRPGYARYLVRTAIPLGNGEAKDLATHSQSMLSGVSPLVGCAPPPPETGDRAATLRPSRL